MTSPQDKPDIWTALASPIPPDKVQWRQQGRPKARDGKFFAPFVAYIDAQYVRERLDTVVPGEWALSLTPLPNRVSFEGEEDAEPYAFTATLEILGVEREDVGQGRDYKQASTDAFKRAAVRFGIAHELYTDYEIVYVQVDGEGKYAKPLEDPGTVYARKHGHKTPHPPVKPLVQGAGTYEDDTERNRRAVEAGLDMAPVKEYPATDANDFNCPKCGGRVWDNRLTKRNPKAPDFKCRDRSCDGVIWPPKGENVAAAKTVQQQEKEHEYDEIPF
jgi:hypothetical protein